MAFLDEKETEKMLKELIGKLPSHNMTIYPSQFPNLTQQLSRKTPQSIT